MEMGGSSSPPPIGFLYVNLGVTGSSLKEPRLGCSPSGVPVLCCHNVCHISLLAFWSLLTSLPHLLPQLRARSGSSEVACKCVVNMCRLI